MCVWGGKRMKIKNRNEGKPLKKRKNESKTKIKKKLHLIINTREINRHIQGD